MCLMVTMKGVRSFALALTSLWDVLLMPNTKGLMGMLDLCVCGCCQVVFFQSNPGLFIFQFLLLNFCVCIYNLFIFFVGFIFISRGFKFSMQLMVSMMIVPPPLSDGVIIMFLFIDRFLSVFRYHLDGLASSVWVRVVDIIPCGKHFLMFV